MKCPNCQNEMGNSNSWLWEGKTFQREQCEICGYKGKAFVVSTFQKPTPLPQTPQKEEKNTYHKDELNTRLNNCIISATNIKVEEIKKLNGYRELAPKEILDYAWELYNGCEQIKLGIYQK